MSGCCSSDTSAVPSTAVMTFFTCSPSLRSVARSSPKIFTAMFARVPESMWSMRWEIGWPMVTFVPGTAESLRRRSARNSSLLAILHLQADFHLGGVHVLRVLVELRAAGAARGGDDFGLAEEDLLDHPAEAVGRFERRAGQRDEVDGERPFVEVGQERAARERERDAGDRRAQRRRRW